MRVLKVIFLVSLILAGCIASPTPPPPTPAAPTPTSRVVENTPQSAPQSIPPTPTTPPPTETTATQPAKHPLILISWDGGQAEMVYQMMADGLLPHFASLAAQGIQAEYAQSVDPSLTAPAQNAIASGSYPIHTGIVSNSFHNPNDSIYWYRRGYDEAMDQAEPVWVTASEQGLTTASVFFNGGTPLIPGQTADYTIGYGFQDAYSDQITVTLETPEEAWEGEIPKSFSPALEGSYTIQEVSRVFFYLIDPTDDQQTNYSQLVINTERKANPETPILQVGEWAPLILMPNLTAGADFLFQRIDQKGPQIEITLFHSGVFHNTASPRTLQNELNQKFGFFPAGSDSYAVEDGWISAEENLYLINRASQWMAQVTAWVYQTYQPDLLYAWQDGFDSAGHAYLMQDETQLNYSPELAQAYQSYFQEAAQAADDALATILEAVDLENATVMLVSDHGMAPIHSVVYVNTILEQARLLTLDRRNYVVVEKTKAFAVASGGSVHVYINLAGHEKDGFVPSEEYESIQQTIIDLLENLANPLTGEKVFQRVLRQNELSDIHLDHLNAGDVFAQAYPGYHLDGWRGNDFIFEPAPFYGQHGYDSSLPEMRAIFIAAGFGVPTSGEIIPPVQIVDYAPTIANLLGFIPASTVDGSPIPALLQKP